MYLSHLLDVKAVNIRATNCKKKTSLTGYKYGIKMSGYFSPGNGGVDRLRAREGMHG